MLVNRDSFLNLCIFNCVFFYYLHYLAQFDNENSPFCFVYKSTSFIFSCPKSNVINFVWSLTNFSILTCKFAGNKFVLGFVDGKIKELVQLSLRLVGLRQFCQGPPAKMIDRLSILLSCWYPHSVYFPRFFSILLMESLFSRSMPV